MDAEGVFAVITAITFVLIPIITLIKTGFSEKKDKKSEEELEAINRQSKMNTLLYREDNMSNDSGENPSEFSASTFTHGQAVKAVFELATVKFDTSNKEYWYKIREGISVSVKDKVLVETGVTGTKIAIVTGLHFLDTTHLNMVSTCNEIHHYKYIIKKWDETVATKKYHLFKVLAKASLYNQNNKIPIWVLDENNSFKYGDSIQFEYKGIINFVILNELHNREMICNEIDAPYPIYKMVTINDVSNRTLPSVKIKSTLNNNSNDFHKVVVNNNRNKYKNIEYYDSFINDLDYWEKEQEREREIELYIALMGGMELVDKDSITDAFFDEDYRYSLLNNDPGLCYDPWSDVDERLSNEKIENRINNI